MKLVTANEMIELAQDLSWGDNIRYVTFKNVKFEEGAIREFVKHFEPKILNTKLPFEFHNTKLNTRQIRLLSDKFKHFTKLHFNNTGLNDDSIKIISNHIKKNPDNISTVHLENNRFGPDGHNALINSLKQNTHIDKLFLNNTHEFSPNYDAYGRGKFKGVYQNFSKLLEKNSSLRIVGVQERNMPVEYLDILSRGIKKNTGLHSLELGTNVFNRDRSGRTTRTFSNSVAAQGIINEVIVGSFKKISNRSSRLLKKTLENNKELKKQFLDALESGDLDVMKAMFFRKSVNLNWTTDKDNKYYNALHLIAQSKLPGHVVESVIQLLYNNSFKNILYKRSGSAGKSIQPIKLANNLGRNDIAQLLRYTQPSLSKCAKSHQSVAKENHQVNNRNRIFKDWHKSESEWPSLATAMVKG